LRKLVYLTRALGIIIIVMVMTNILFSDDEKGQKTKEEQYKAVSTSNDTEYKDDNKEDSNKEDSNKEDDNKKDDNKESKKDESKESVDKEKNKDVDKKNIAKIEEKKEDTKKASSNEKVTVDIEAGIKSEQIANRLQKAGVIKDSKAFNKFMVEHGYDSNVRTGTFAFKKNMAFVDIRNVLIKEEYR